MFLDSILNSSRSFTLDGLEKRRVDAIDCMRENRFRSYRGIWYNDNPFAFIFPTVLIKIILLTIISRSLYWLCRPIGQSKFICYVLGGMLLGPSFLGRKREVWDKLFPRRENELLGTLAVLGAIYSIFVIGVKMDNSLILRSAKNSWKIGFAGFITPLITSYTITFGILGVFPGTVLRGPFTFYVPLSMCYSFFPVLAHALEELNLINSELGQLAMSAAILNDIIYWFFLGLSIALKQIKLTAAIYAFLSFLCLVFFNFTFIKRYILNILKKTPEGKPVTEYYIVVLMIGVLFMAFLSSFIGATFILGPLMLGFIIPSGPPLGSNLVQKTEAIVTEFLLPMFFLQVGYSTDIKDINNWSDLVQLETILVVAYLAKYFAIVVSSMLCKISFRSAAVLGLIMNIKGFLELLHMQRWKAGHFVDDQTYTVLVLSNMGLTMIVTPLISLFSVHHTRLGPSRNIVGVRSLRSMSRNTEFRILCCVHSEDNVHGMITLLEASNPSLTSPICAYIVQTAELVGLAAPLMVPYDKRRRRKKLSAFSSSTEQVARAFENYSKNSRGPVTIMQFLMVSSYKTMHESICRLSQDKFIPLLVVPFHRSGRFTGGPASASLRQFNASVLATAPCTVGILVDRGLSSGAMGRASHVAVVFVGGPDDREALAYAGRMSDNQSRAMVTVIRVAVTGAEEAELDEAAAEEFRVRTAGNAAVSWREVSVVDSAEAVNAVRSVKGGFNLIMVGRRRSWGDVADETMAEFVENEELGVIGDMLASPDFCGGMVSVLVVQHHIKEFYGYCSRSTSSSSPH